MIAIAVPLFLLLVWNVIFCLMSARRFCVTGNTAMGVFGGLAALGPLGLVALTVFGALAASSGV